MQTFLNIYPWFFWFLLIFGQVAQALNIKKTKKTDGLSLSTFILIAIASMMFGTISFYAGFSSYPLLLSNAFALVFLSYIIYYIIKNKNIKGAFIYGLFFFLFGIVLLLLGSINYFGFIIQDKSYVIISTNIPKWLSTAISTIGGIASTIIFIPQLLTIIKTKETHYLSYKLMFFFILYLINIVIFWIIFGIVNNDWSKSLSTVIFSSIAIVVQACVIYLKYKYENKSLKSNKTK